MDNYLKDVPLRIMNTFEAEQTFDVEPGDVLYVPPKVAHHGVSLNDECTTLSFGYRAYSAQEMAEFTGAKERADGYYQDPLWQAQNTPAFIPQSAVQQAQKILDIDAGAFAKFVTKLDPLDAQIMQYHESDVFDKSAQYQLHPACKIAYLLLGEKPIVFINGEQLETTQFSGADLIDFCNTGTIQYATCQKLSESLFEMGILV